MLIKSQFGKVLTLALPLASLITGSSVNAEPTRKQATLTVSVYNSDTGGAPESPAIVVVRDSKNDTAALKVCSELFKPTSSDARIIAMEALEFELGCIDYLKVQSPTFGYNVFRNYIGRNDEGKAQRVVYTGAGIAGSKRDPEMLLSDVATWTINTFAGGAMLEGDLVLLVGARVANEKTKNPEISSYRQTYTLVGSGQRNGDEIPRM